MSTMARSKADHNARSAEEKKTMERKKNVMVMVMHHLMDHGYMESVETLQNESGINAHDYDVADNIDLPLIVQEFEEYYEVKFGRKPKLVKKIAQPDVLPMHRKSAAGSAGGGGPAALPRIGSVPDGRRGSDRGGRTGGKKKQLAPGDDDDTPESARNGHSSQPPSVRHNKENKGADDTSNGGHVPDTKGLQLGGVSVAVEQVKPQAGGRRRQAAPKDEKEGSEDDLDHWEYRMKKALPESYNANPELKELATWITRDIIQDNPNVRWADIAELGEVKRVLKESLVMPLRYPEYFTGLLRPWKGVMLYGPPGTGKTMLAKAVATECKTTFFNISASSIVSKWRGDSEKLVRVLFELARHNAPATIFLDEIDSIMGQRGDQSEHEGSRRMKTELLIQMDGLASGTEQVFLLAATNLPWELDMAMLRRLEKRILVPFPGPAGRRWIFQRVLSPDRLEAGIHEYDMLVEATEGYSGSDLMLLCKEAAMRPLRRLLQNLEQFEAEGGEKPKPGRVTTEDLQSSIQCTQPTVKHFADKYAQWASEFGST